jgi:hypothetical protein
MGLRYLHQHQFPTGSCQDRKFVTFTFPMDKDTRNVGAVFNTLTIWLALAIRFDRILLVNDKVWNLALCPSHDGECYFEAFSSCKYDDVMQGVDRAKDVFVTSSSEYEGKDWITRAEARQGFRVWEVPPKSAYFPSRQELLLDAFPFPPQQIHYCKFLEAATLFFFRPQPWLAQRVHDALKVSIPDDFDPNTAISMPIRGSDKCNGHQISESARGEVDCSEHQPESYFAQAERVQLFDPAVDTLLITSEDPAIVARCKELAVGTSWKLVWNQKDVMQGTGSASALLKAQPGRSDLTVEDTVASAFSTMVLHTRSRYLLGSFHSSFGLLIMSLHRVDNLCHAHNRMLIYMGGHKKVNFFCG